MKWSELSLLVALPWALMTLVASQPVNWLCATGKMLQVMASSERSINVSSHGIIMRIKWQLIMPLVLFWKLNVIRIVYVLSHLENQTLSCSYTLSVKWSWIKLLMHGQAFCMALDDWGHSCLAVESVQEFVYLLKGIQKHPALRPTMQEYN